MPNEMSQKVATPCAPFPTLSHCATVLLCSSGWLSTVVDLLIARRLADRPPNEPSDRQARTAKTKREAEQHRERERERASGRVTERGGEEESGSKTAARIRF